MKSYSFLSRLGRGLARPWTRLSVRRRGTVIIIVLALLGLLALIGFFAITFTGQENQSATCFANSPTSKVLTPTLNANAFFNDILRQLIIGPGVTEKQSVLWGGNKSLLPTMFGRDLTPYNGQGVNLIWFANSPAVDQNYNNLPDNGTSGELNNSAFLQLNLSPAAQGSVLDLNNFPITGTQYPDPDTNITYPDFNNAFLASDTLVPNGLNTPPSTANLPVRVITPSFHRPMLLRNLAPSTSWYTSAATAPYVMFPHTLHLAIDSSGKITNQYRFVTGAYSDTSGLGTALVPFSIPGDPANGALTPPWGGGPAVQEGVWTAWAGNTPYVLSAQVVPIPPNGQVYSCTIAGTSGATVPAWTTTTGSIVNDGSVKWTAIGPANIGYDVDTDGDGIPDARYMDFGFPLMTDTSGNQFVALGSLKVIDADSLFNLNVHGNRAAPTQIPAPSSFAGGSNTPIPSFLSESDQGVSASEVNPEWALNARPTATSPDFTGSTTALASALQQYTLLFRTSGSTFPIANNFDPSPAAVAQYGQFSFELANMEWWNLLNGRPQLAVGTPPTVSGSSFVGRWGENVTHLDPFVTQILAGTSFNAGVGAVNPVTSANPTGTDPFPLPGTWGVDDNYNAPEGGSYNDVQNVYHPAFVQPIDFFAAGWWVNYSATAPPQGQQRLLYPYLTKLTAAGNAQFPQYSEFWVSPATSWATALTALTPPSALNWNVWNVTPPALPPYSQLTPTAFSGRLMGSGTVLNGGGQLLIDEPDEVVTEPSAAAQQSNDSIFGASENAIQLSSGDYSALGSPGRTASLMPFDFVANQRASLIRQRFTSTSWDLKSFGKEFFGADTTAGAGPYDARRLWEFTDTSTGATGAGPFRFPPNFGGGGAISPMLPPYPSTPITSPAAQPTYPMRLAVSNLLQVLANPNINPSSNPASGPYTTGALPQTSLVQPQRLLSINGLTEMYQNGTDSTPTKNPIYQFRFRPLTPHPSTSPSISFANTAILPFPGAGSSLTIPSVSWIAEPEQLATAGGTPAQQEWLARYDRQRMARDIYTTLYLMGGGADTKGAAAFNYAGNVSAIPANNQPSLVTGVRPLYTDDQLAEMAQFAVNLVDALDPDSNITLFEYDKDLSDGWNLDDNPYDATNDPIMTTHPLDRGLVYGVERQQLCLNEAMVTFSQKCVNTQLVPPTTPADHPDTQWNDTNVWSFFYTELENVGPTAVTFNNAQWQIAVKPSPIVSAPTNPGYPYYGTPANPTGEMRLTFTSLQPPIAAGTSPRLTIGGVVGSTDGITYNVPLVDPVSGAQLPSWMVVNPNHADLTYGGTAYDHEATTDPALVGFPIAPRAAYLSPTTTNASALNLDLSLLSQNGNYIVSPPSSLSPSADGTPATSGTPLLPTGAQLLQFNDPSANIMPGTAPVVLRIELRRRADLNRVGILPSDSNPVAEAADNPWIAVDYMDVPVSVLALKLTGNNSDFSTQIQYQLGNLLTPPSAPTATYNLYAKPGGAAPSVSTERSQPLYHDYTLNPFIPSTVALSNGPYAATLASQSPRNGGVTTLKPPLWQGNSLGKDNDAAGFNPGTIPSSTATTIAPHPLYQPHYDRDFSSVGELFNIPLYGQMQSPQWFPNANFAVGATIVPPSGGAAAGVGGLTFICTQAGKSGGTQPSWPTTAPATVPPDGSVVWMVASPAQTQMFTGLTHVMASRVTESSATVAASTSNYTPEMLVGADYIPTNTVMTPPPFQHYNGYGTAGFRFEHPEGADQTQSNPAVDFTENRWYRLLGMVEVPTRSHRGINEPNNVAPYQVAAGSINGSLGFYRTPGKININTLRYPDIVAGLVGEPDIFNMNFTAALPTGLNLPANLSVPYLLQDITGGDSVASAPPQNPVLGTAAARDWWEQFIATRDGVDPLAVGSGGTGLSIPGMPRSINGTAPPLGLSVTPGSHPFRGMGFSAYGGVDANGYNGPLESTILRALGGDAVTPPAAPTPANSGAAFDLRRRLFELGTYVQHTGSRPSTSPPPLDYATKQRLLSRLVGNTTTRSNVFFVWIQVDFFQAKDVGPSLTPADTGVVRIGAKLGTSPAYRGFFVIDRSQALPLVTSQYLPTTTTGQPFVFSFNQSFNWQSLVLYQQRIQ